MVNGEIDKRQYEYHHIIPNHELVSLLKSTRNLSIEDRKKVLNNYLNKDHIKSVIIKNDLINKTYLGTHGKLIHAAVSNNPHNLVYGPGKDLTSNKHRGRDPGEKKDVEILDKQTTDYKAAMTNYGQSQVEYQTYHISKL